ncbi:MAG TPA: hypothetical protein VF766_07120 [Pyrinomonadaceae bacterium]
MSLTASIVTYVLGIAVATLIYRLLGRRISEAIALGVSVMVMLLAFYPLTLWLTDEPSQSLRIYTIWSALGALTATGLCSLLVRRAKDDGR